MNYWNDLREMLLPYDLHVMLGSILFNALLLMLVLALIYRFRKISIKVERLLGDSQVDNLEEHLLFYNKRVEEAARRQEDLSNQIKAIVEWQKKPIQKIGLVRFNAFPDVGSDLSFAVALMDAGNNGIVINTLYGRDDCRTYAKTLVNGKSNYRLTQEEMQAIQQAIGD